jgi:Flp pilus assembly protein TadG
MKPIRSKSERGNAMLEFALGWSILWMVFSGLYQIGYAYYLYNIMLESTSSAAALGSRLPFDTGNTSAFTTTLKNMVLYGDETAGTNTLVPNLTASNVNVNYHPDANGFPQYITVNITGYTINALFKSFSLPNKPGATTKYYGQITCSGC